MWERFSDIFEMLDGAAQSIRKKLYTSTSEKLSRDDEIRKRHSQGESNADLAKAFNLAPTRIWQIIHRTR